MIDYSILLFIIAASLSSIGGIFFGLYFNNIFSLGSLLNRKKERKKIHDLNIRKENNIENEIESNQIPITANTTYSDSALQTKNMQLLEDNIKIYKFEKDLASSAIEHILTASKNKTIDNFEKDRLLLKYRDHLNKLNNKMEKIQSEIDVTKLIDLRNDLASLLDNKISDIDEKIKEINTKIGSQTSLLDLRNIKKNNKNKNDNNSSYFNKNPNSSTYDNNIEQAIDNNLKPKYVTSYKTDKSYNQKESLVNEERKKISDLKVGVLEALKRLDKAKNVKEEIKSEVLAIQDNNKNEPTGFIDVDKENSLSQRQNVDKNESEKYTTMPTLNTLTNTIKQNNSLPKIFNSLTKRKSQTNIITSTLALNPILENTSNKDTIINTNDVNSNKKEKFDISIKENSKNIYNQNEKTPLHNALNYSKLKTASDVKSKNVSINNKDKVGTEDTSSLVINNPKKKIKFSFRSIFSRDKRVRNEEIKTSDTDTDIDKKDSLNNILNKKRK